MQRDSTHVSAVALQRLAGITYRQLDYWTRVGYLTPINKAPGSGNARYYTRAESRVAVAMSHLVRDGMAPDRAVVQARRSLAPKPVRRHGWRIAGVRRAS